MVDRPRGKVAPVTGAARGIGLRRKVAVVGILLASDKAVTMIGAGSMIDGGPLVGTLG